MVERAAITAWRPVTDALPSDLIAGSADFENGGRSVNNRLIWPAAAFRLLRTGVLLVAAALSFAKAGRSCSRNPGSLAQVAERLPDWVAVAVAVRFASSMNRWTACELFASAVTTVSALTVSACSVCESL